MRRFFVSPLPHVLKPLCTLSKEESHHVFRVVKIAKGEEVVLFDGQGKSCIAILKGTQDQHAQMQWVRDLEEACTQKQLWLYLCTLKQQAWSTSLRMATELGVHHIVPVLSERSIVRKEKHDRWNNIILAAAKQSGRSLIPNLHSMMTFSEVCTQKHAACRYVLSPGESSSEITAITQTTMLCIGPEGGFSKKEILLARQEDWKICGLNSAVLRADTAVAASLSLLLLSSAASTIGTEKR